MLVIGSEVVLLRRLVAFRGEPAEPVVEDVDPQGIDAADEHVYSQVELVALDEQWVGHVALHHAVLADLNLYLTTGLPYNLLTR